MHPQEWVQPILVAPTGSHLGVLNAVARASALVFPDDLSPWREWLADSFAKTVRRATLAQLAAAEEAGGLRVATPDGAEAVALLPSRYADLPRYVARARVQGLTRPAPEPSWAPSGALQVAVRADAGMSTGKAAAQAAHAALAAVVALDPTTRRATAETTEVSWVDAATFEALLGHATAVSITDEGRTEVEPGTVTAVAVRMK